MIKIKTYRKIIAIKCKVHQYIGHHCSCRSIKIVKCVIKQNL